MGESIETGDIVNDAWVILERVGRGTFSELFVAKNIENDSIVAIKVQNSNIDSTVLKVSSQ